VRQSALLLVAEMRQERFQLLVAESLPLRLAPDWESGLIVED
jgi:hypothetical protein